MTSGSHADRAGELVETDLSSIGESPLINPDLAPVGTSRRTWGMYDIAALWISMSACIPTYMLASSLIAEGMNWYQAVLTVFIGNAIVLVPMILNGHAGTKYGIPFPVYCRAAFGVRGANIPALLRAFVACGWFGIQTWIGGWAIYKIIAMYVPSWDLLPPWIAGINIAQFACFMFFWGINMAVIYRGIESIRFLLDIKAPLLIALGLVLLAWAYQQAGGFGPMLSQPSQFVPGGAKDGQFWAVFFPSLTGMVGFWATLSLNIPDFTRYARSQRDQMLGQAIGLPATMGLYAFIGVAVTSATIVIYGGPPIWDPVVLITRFTNPLVLALSLFALCLATLATNLAANVVSPANDFSNLWPSRITFRTGGLITGIIGILIQPWKDTHLRLFLRAAQDAPPGRPVRSCGTLHIPEWLQSCRSCCPVSRHRAKRARVSRHGEAPRPGNSRAVPDAHVQLCVVRRTGNGVCGVRGAYEETRRGVRVSSSSLHRIPDSILWWSSSVL
jgi:NCS1 family nucleobase:cation symporter-1